MKQPIGDATRHRAPHSIPIPPRIGPHRLVRSTRNAIVLKSELESLWSFIYSRLFETNSSFDRTAIPMTDASPTSLTVQLAHTLSGHTSDVNTVLFSPAHATSPLLTSCSSDKTIRIWNMIDQSSTTLTRHTYQVHCLAFSPAANDASTTYMASVSTDGTCLLWDLTTFSVLKEYKHDSGSPIRVCRFSPNGMLLATGKSSLLYSHARSRPRVSFSG